MTRRQKIPVGTQTDVLIKSRRRCCVCFGLNRDDAVKKGQIAHIDGDRNNDRIDNLAFMCLEHHDQFDSTTSQSKNITINEVKRFREELYNKYIIWSSDEFPIGLLNYLASTVTAEDIAKGIIEVGHQVTGFPHWFVEIAMTEKSFDSIDGDNYIPLHYILSHLQSWGIVHFECTESASEVSIHVHFDIKQKNPEFCGRVYEIVKVKKEEHEKHWRRKLGSFAQEID